MPQKKVTILYGEPLEGVPLVKDRPPGYRLLHEPLNRTKKAVQFRYYKWLLWIPRSKTVRLPTGEYATFLEMIETAKAHPSAKTIDDLE